MLTPWFLVQDRKRECRAKQTFKYKYFNVISNPRRILSPSLFAWDNYEVTISSAGFVINIMRN